MLSVASACPLRVALVRWQPRAELSAVTVVCKATFTLGPGVSPLAPVQEMPHAADVRWDDDPRASLRAASDLVPFKRHVDVLVLGHAHAPHGLQVTSLIARIAVSGLDKSVAVHGDRSWTSDGQLTAAASFTRMPLRWERAAGGPSTWNPVGCAPGSKAPNLLPAGVALRSPAEAVPAIGLGPIASTWPERSAALHRHAATFRHGAWAEQPLPEDIDGAYFNAAPPDQQIAELAPSVQLLLEHLHPQHSQLITNLEEVIPHAVAEREGAAPQEIRLRCDTLCVDADQGTCTLVWRGALILRSADEDPSISVTASRRDSDEDAQVVTPVRRGSVDAIADVGPTQALAFSAFQGDAAAEEALAQTLSPALVAARPVLPFTPPGSPAAPQAEGSAEGLPAARPFGAAPAAPPAASEDGPHTMNSAPATAPVQPLPLPQPAAQPLGAQPLGAQPLGAQPLGAQPFPSAPARPHIAPIPPGPPQSHTQVAPPPLIVPLTPPPVEITERLAPPPMVVPVAPITAAEGPPERDAQDAPLTARCVVKPPSTPPESPASPASAAPAEVDTPPPACEVRPEDIPLDRHAAVAAELAEGRAPRADVLRAHALEEHAWHEVDRHWRAVLDKDGRASGRLRAAHDAAYVAAVEHLRGPITLPEYARISIALARGEANQALDALAIQRPALSPIVRVWTQKVATDPKLSAELMALLSGLRAAE